MRVVTHHPIVTVSRGNVSGFPNYGVGLATRRMTKSYERNRTRVLAWPHACGSRASRRSAIGPSPVDSHDAIRAGKPDDGCRQRILVGSTTGISAAPVITRSLFSISLATWSGGFYVLATFTAPKTSNWFLGQLSSAIAPGTFAATSEATPPLPSRRSGSGRLHLRHPSPD